MKRTPAAQGHKYALQNWQRRRQSSRPVAHAVQAEAQQRQAKVHAVQAEAQCRCACGAGKLAEAEEQTVAQEAITKKRTKTPTTLLVIR
jgi:hypothetical protein